MIDDGLNDTTTLAAGPGVWVNVALFDDRDPSVAVTCAVPAV